MEMKPLIQLSNLSYAYPYAPPAIQNINQTINAGEKIAIVGSNGAGKSTLLLTLNGMLRPVDGRITFQGKPVLYDKKSLRTLRQKVGFVFQDPDVQIIAPTVWQDVAFGPVNLDYPEEKIKEVVQEALHKVGLEGFERRPPYHLSGGEKKRVAIAGVLAMDPDVLILDEPTSMLDPAGSEDIMDLLDELNQHGKTIIISTHDVELAYPWADRVILMENGRITASGTPEKAFSDRELVKRARLKTPILLELCQELAARGIKNGEKLPTTVLDIIRIIENEHHGNIRLFENGYGSIHVADVDLLSGKKAVAFMNDMRCDTVGVMGSRAKICSRQWGITPDISYAVIDKCILQAMNGKTCAIFTSKGMVSRVIERVNEFNAINNRSIPVQEISVQTPDDQ